VAHSLPPASQKRLLFFVTGSDRVPIKVGMLAFQTSGVEVYLGLG
jgi:hypothetical protein